MKQQGESPAGLDKEREFRAAARSAHLRYVSDADRGFSRRRRGKSFTYVEPSGKVLRDSATVTRIRALAIPPAWTDVWICPTANGHLQATGRDARGRKQYRYHPRWREARDENKYERMIAFAKALPKIRRAVARHLRKRGLPREKVLAAAVKLLETTLIRVGNDEYARDNHSFGLTTMHDKHVEVRGATIRFEFRGKHGIEHEIDLEDRRLAKIVRECQDLPGQELFQYVDDDGRGPRRRLRRRERLPARDQRRGFHGQGFSHLGRHGARGAGTAGVRGLRLDGRGQAEHHPGDRAGRRAAGQHAGHLPQVLRAPGDHRRLHGPLAASRR